MPATNQGRHADAEPLYKRALAIREKALGPDHRDVAQSLHNLGLLYGSQRRYADAEQVYQRALTIREKGSRSRSSECRSNTEQFGQRAGPVRRGRVFVPA